MHSKPSTPPSTTSFFFYVCLCTHTHTHTASSKRAGVCTQRRRRGPLQTLRALVAIRALSTPRRAASAAHTKPYNRYYLLYIYSITNVCYTHHTHTVTRGRWDASAQIHISRVMSGPSARWMRRRRRRYNEDARPAYDRARIGSACWLYKQH